MIITTTKTHLFVTHSMHLLLDEQTQIMSCFCQRLMPYSSVRIDLFFSEEASISIYIYIDGIKNVDEGENDII